MHTIFLIIIFTTLPLFSSAAEKNTVLEFDFSTAPRYTPSLFNLCLQVIYSLKDTPEKEKIVKCEQIQEKWQKCCTDLEPWKKGYTFLPGNKENISFSHDGIIYGYTDTNTIKRFINMQNNSILDTFFNDLYTHTFPSDTSSCYISRHHHMKFITKKALAPNSPQYAASLVASLPDIANFPQVCAVDAYINNNIILLHTKNFPWIHLQNGHWQELRNTDADILPVITKYDPKKDIIIMYDEVHNLISLWNRKNDLYQPFLSLPLAQRRMFGCYFVDATIIPASTRHKIRFFMLLGDPAEYHALTIPDDAIDPKKAILTKIHPDTFDTIHPAQDGVHYWVEEHTSSKEKMLKYCKKGKILQQFYVQKPAKIIAVHAHALAIRQQKENDFETHIFHNHPLVLGDEVKDKYDKDDTGNTVLRTLALS